MFAFSYRLYCTTADTAREPRERGGSHGNTVDTEEVDKFGRLAQTWWDRNGEFAALHSMNAIRVPLIRDALVQLHKDHSDHRMLSKPLQGLDILDVGCGGGILSEVTVR